MQHAGFAFVGLSLLSVAAPANAVASGDLVISEILADNRGAAQDEAGEFDDWIELVNRSAEPIALRGLYLSDDEAAPQQWALPDVTLDPGAYILIWADDDVTQSDRHANFRLNAAGDQVFLFDSAAHRLDHVAFGRQNPDVSIGRLGTDLRADYLVPPTPNAANDASALFAPVCINEFQTTSAAGGIDDWVELFNRGDQPVDMAGWGISDDRTRPMRYRLPLNSVIAPQGYVVIDEATLGFSFTSDGEEIVVTAADGVTGYDFFEFGPQTADITEGRLADGTTRWLTLSPTPGRANANPVLLHLPSLSASPAANPRMGGASVWVTLRQAVALDIAVFDTTGRRVASLISRNFTAGRHRVDWGGIASTGRPAAAGRYWIVAESADEQTSTAITLTR